MSASLFLGLGKVNRSIASVLEGEKIAFVEDAKKLKIYEWKTDWELKEEREVSFDSFNWQPYLPAKVFISPGIDPRRKFFYDLKQYEIRELDFFANKFPGKIIAVTGTDGKSTFSSHLASVLQRALPNKKVFLGGNIGNAMCEGLKQTFDLAVLEVSSFQAERLKAVRPELVILLNLSRDHLDRYPTEVEYHLAKWDLVALGRAKAFPEDLQPPAFMPPQKSVVSFRQNESLLEVLKKITVFLAESLEFEVDGHLFENLASLPHRLEEWEDKDGRLFVNDSKATTVHAVLYGLTALKKKKTSIKLILGGRSKGDDFAQLSMSLSPSDQVLLYGEARDEISRQLSGFQGKIRTYSSLKKLLDEEVPNLKRGECLALSPACSSFDEFKNFEERGEFFLKNARAQAIL